MRVYPLQSDLTTEEGKVMSTTPPPAQEDVEFLTGIAFPEPLRVKQLNQNLISKVFLMISSTVPRVESLPGFFIYAVLNTVSCNWPFLSTNRMKQITINTPTIVHARMPTPTITLFC